MCTHAGYTHTDAYMPTDYVHTLTHTRSGRINAYVYMGVYTYRICVYMCMWRIYTITQKPLPFK